MITSEQRKKTLCKFFDQLEEENQQILVAEAYDLLHVQELKKKHEKRSKSGDIIEMYRTEERE